MSNYDSHYERDLTWFYGDGSDGDVEITGAITLVREMHYRNLTVSAGAAINQNGCRIFVREVLDLSAAQAGAFVENGSDGTDASGATGGTANPNYFVGYNVGAEGTNRYAGVSGGTGAGGNANFQYNPSAYGGCGGAAGAGGLGSGGAGGTVPATNASNYSLSSLRLVGDFNLHPWRYKAGAYWIAPAITGGGGGNGAAGGGDGVNSGGGGGSGGCSGSGDTTSPTTTGSPPIIWIGARTIQRGTNSNTSIFQLNGGNGGNGGTPAAGNCGGGGGGGGAGGGTVYIYCDNLLGSTIADAIEVSGGDGGDGGGKTGTGVVGDGGDGGGSGEVAIIECSKESVTYTTPGTSVANAGQTGGTGTVLLVDL